MTKGIMNTRNQQALVGLIFVVMALMMFANGFLHLIKHFINLTPVPVEVLTDIAISIINGAIAYRLLWGMKSKGSKKWLGSKNLKLLGIYWVITATGRFFELHTSINEYGFYKIFFVLIPIYLAYFCFKEANKIRRKKKNKKMKLLKQLNANLSDAQTARARFKGVRYTKL